MAFTNPSIAEEALSLPTEERAKLAKLLITSLEGDSRTHEEIKAALTRRLKDLTTGKDAGLSFSEVFSRKRLKRH